MRLSFPPLPRLFVCLGALLLPFAAQAQTATIVSPITIYANIGSASNGAAGVAEDASGNLYMAVGTSVLEWNASTHAVSTYASGFVSASAVALDASGGLYVADSGGSLQYIPAGQGAAIAFPSAADAVAVAVSTAGMPAVLVGQTVVVPTAGSSPATYASFTAIDLGTNTLLSPMALAFGPRGDLYIADSGYNQVERVSPLSTGVFSTTSPNTVTTVLSNSIIMANGESSDGVCKPIGTSCLSRPNGVAVDAANNLYVDDAGNRDILELVGGGYATATEIVSIAGQGAYGVGDTESLVVPGPASEISLTPLADEKPAGITLDGNGQLLMPTSSGVVWAMPLLGIYAPRVTVGTTATQTWYLQDTTTPSSTTVGFRTSTTGATFVTSDFKYSGTYVLDAASGDTVGTYGKNCTTSLTLSAISTQSPHNDFCELDVAFMPSQAGPRSQPLTVPITSNTKFAFPVQGVGLAPIPSITSAGSIQAALTTAPGASGLSDLAVNPWGAIFGTQGTNIVEVTGGGLTTVFNAGVGVSGIAFDSSGNLYFANGPAGEVEELPVTINTTSKTWSYAASATVVFSKTGMAPYGLAVDAAGDIFVADHALDAVYEYSNGALTTLASVPALGVAVDASGNIYVSEPSTGTIVNIAGGVTTTVASSLSGTLGYLHLDPAGNLYAAAGGAVYLISSPSSSTPVVTTLAGTGASGTPAGDGGAAAAATFTAATTALPVPGASNAATIYVSDSGTATTDALRSIASNSGSLTFATTVGAPQTLSPTLVNLGTSSVSITSAGASPAAPFTAALSNTPTTGVCTNALVLAPGGSCTAPVTYAPTQATPTSPVTPDTATLTYTFSAGTATINASGTATVPAQTATTLEALAGSGQSATVNTAYGTTLEAEVLDQNNSPMAGVTVVFTAPASGASGTFANGALTTSAVTNSSGIASATLFTANTAAGGFSVGAAVVSPSLATSFSLTNTAGPLAQITVVLPALVTAGQATTAATATYDAWGNPVTVGNLSFTSSDSAAALPSPSPAGNVTVTFNTVGPQTLTASNGAISGSASTTVLVTSVGFPLTPVNPPAPITQPVTIGFPSAATVGSIQVVTEGYTGLDFTNAGSGSCAIGAQAAGSTCTLAVQFKPTAVGQRLGAIVIYDNNNNVLQTIYLSGIGQGALAAYTGGTVSTYAAPATVGLAIDAKGNVYVPNTDGDGLMIYAPGAFNSPVSVTLPVGSIFVSSLAFDGAGNLYISNPGGSTAGVLRIPNVNGVLQYANSTNIPLDSSMLTVDGAGNVFVLSVNPNQIYKIAPGAATAQLLATTGIVNPQSMVFGNDGNLYVTDVTSNVIYEIANPETASPATTAITVAAGKPAGIGADPAGDLYIGDSSTGKIYAVSNAGGSLAFTSPTLVATVSGAPRQVAFDASGNMYIVSDPTGSTGQLTVIRQVAPPAQTYAQTNVGSSSTAQTQALANIGNLPLSLSNIGFDPNFPNHASTCSSSLATGVTCDFITAFAPTATGNPVSGTLTIADNAVNETANQTIAQSGVAVGAPITVTASSTTITYGQAVPAVTPALTSGTLIGSDTLQSIGITCAVTGTPSGAGNYATVCSGTPANYVVTYVSGSLTVSRAAITVTASSPAAITYGAATPAITGSVTTGALVGTDTLSSIGVTCSAAPTGAGTFATSCSGSPANYSVTYVAGSLTVNKASITVAASSPSITYGQTSPAVTPTITSGALVGTDTLSSIGITCSAASNTGAAGTYTTSCTGTPSNYDVTFTGGTLTIGKAAITVTASSPAAITYGAATPAITGSVTSGALVGTDTLSSIGVTCSVTPTGAGTFATSCSGSPANYAVSYVAGSLTVNKASITVAASSPTITYGQTAPAVTPSITSGALVGTDTLGSIGITCSVASNTGAAGTYTTSCTGTPSNYDVTFAGGTLTIGKAAITVTASSPVAITYGAATPAITGSVTTGALVGTDTLSSIGVTCSVTATGAGTFATSCSGSPANYAVSYVAGSLTVNKASITVAASSPSITYGQTAPTVTPSITAGALVGTDTLSSIGITCSAASNTGAAGTYTTSCSGTPSNYDVTFTGGTLTIGKAAITVTASSPAAITYGAATPAITGSVTTGALVGTDTLSSIGVTCSVAPVGAGTFATSCSGSPANYAVSYVAGSLTVNKASITVAASSPSITYGQTAPTVTPSITAGALVGTDTLSSIGITCSAASNTGAAGSYATSCTGTPSNYDVTFTGGSLTIGKAAITVTASSPAAITYGAATPAITGSVTTGALVGTDTLSSIGVTCSVNATGAGTFATSCSGSPANYNVTYVAGSLTVSKASITVAASSPSITYGQAAPAVTGSVTSGALVGTDTLSSIGITCAAATNTGAAGTYATSCSGTPSNYSVTFTGGTLTIGKASITVTASSPAAITYGAATPAITGSVTTGALVGTDTLSSIGVTCSAAPTGAGTFATLCSGSPANYAVSYVAGSLTVNKASITVAASSPSITYGQTAPAVTPSITSGALVGTDTLGSIGITCSVASNTGAAGTYTTSCTGTPSNYDVTFTGGSLTIGKASITVTASSPAAITYGAATPAITGSVTAGALVGTDTLSSIGVTCSAAPTGAGTFATSCSGSPANYAVSYVAGSLTVNKASITVAASSPSITYGQTAPAVTPSITSGALVGTDTLSSIGITCSVASNTGAAGSYATSCTGTPSNYDVTFTNGSLTIGKASLTVTASSPAAITYGAATPAITGSVTTGALVGTDTLSSIGVTCSAAPTGAGTFATSCSGTPANYAVSYVAGSLTVNKASITVAASSPTITYGQTAPAVTPTITSGALVGTDTLGSIGITCSVASNTGAAGTYATSCTGTPSNYDVTFTNGSLTIGKASLTVTASSPAAITYGAATPAITGSVTTGALVGTDTLSSIGVTCSAAPTGAGTFATSCSGSPANYSVTYVAGSLTVNKASITVAASSPTITYGQTAPAVTPTITSGALVGTDTLGSIGITCSVASNTGAAGTYATSCSGTPSNYDVTFTNGSLTIGQAAITVAASSPTVTYGQPTPAITASLASGALVGTDTLSSIGITCSSAANTGAAGSYATTCSGNPANYSVSFTGGTLTINKVAITVTASSPTASYGTTPTVTPTLTSGTLATGDTLTSIGITCTSADNGSSGAGSAPTTSCSGNPANYTVTFVGGTVTVSQAAITVTANSPSTTYGTVAAASGTVTSGSLVGADTLSSIGVTCSTTDTAASVAGSNPTTSCSGVPANYTVTYINGTVTINKAAITVTASSPAATYGTTPTVTPTLTSGTLATGDTLSSIGITCTSTDNGSSAAGSNPTTSCSGSPANYNVTFITGTVSVNKAAITVTASSPATIYGIIPTVTPTLTAGALANGDTLSSIGITCSTSDTVTSAVGSAPATSCSGNPANYAVTFVSGVVTISPANQVITFPSLSGNASTGSTITLSAVSSAGLPITYVVSGPATLVGNVLTITGPGTVTITAESPASGNYAAAAPVTQTVSGVQGLAWGLYATSNVCDAINLNGNIVIDSYDSSLGVYPAGLTKANGNIGSNGQVQLNGNVTVYGTLYDPHGNTRGSCVHSTPTNSLLTNGNATVTAGITPLPAAINFPAPTLPTAPTTNQTINGTCGSVNGCTQVGNSHSSHVALAPGTYGNLVINGCTTVDFSAGTYIFNSLVLNGNSVLNVVSGPVVIELAQNGSSAALDISGGTVVNNLAPAQLEILYAGTSPILLNGGTQAAAVVYTPNAPVTICGNGHIQGTIIGATITDNGNVDIDYDRSLVNTPIPGSGSNPPALQSQTISFGSLANTTYGAAAISLGATASSGLPVSYSVTGPATLNGSALVITGAGAVTVTASQAGNGTYQAATSVVESFTVAPAVLTVAANNLSVSYGQVDPDRCGRPQNHLNFTYLVSGFVNGDTTSILSGAPSFTTTATQSSAPGSYPIVISQGTLSAGSNYTFQFVNGTLTVTKAVLTVTGCQTSVGYGQVDLDRCGHPENHGNYSYTVTGFVNGDSQKIICGNPSYSTGATWNSQPGNYPINVGQGSLSTTNGYYTFQFVNGALTVTGNGNGWGWGN